MDERRLIIAPTHTECALGGLYLAVELFLLPTALNKGNQLLSNPLPELWLNLLFFTLNFLVVVCIFHKYLWRSFLVAWNRFWETLQAAVLGYVAYDVSVKLISFLVIRFYPDFSNANDVSINGLLAQNRFLMFFALAIMVPVTEECFHRGVIFAGLYKKNRILAYGVSTLVFAAIHVLGYLGSMSGADLLLCYLQYLPAGLWLAWSYEKSGTIVTPIAVHAAVNLMGIYG